MQKININKKILIFQIKDRDLFTTLLLLQWRRYFTDCLICPWVNKASVTSERQFAFFNNPHIKQAVLYLICRSKRLLRCSEIKVVSLEAWRPMLLFHPYPEGGKERQRQLARRRRWLLLFPQSPEGNFGKEKQIKCRERGREAPSASANILSPSRDFF